MLKSVETPKVKTRAGEKDGGVGVSSSIGGGVESGAVISNSIIFPDQAIKMK